MQRNKCYIIALIKPISIIAVFTFATFVTIITIQTFFTTTTHTTIFAIFAIITIHAMIAINAIYAIHTPKTIFQCACIKFSCCFIINVCIKTITINYPKSIIQNNFVFFHFILLKRVSRFTFVCFNFNFFYLAFLIINSKISTFSIIEFDSILWWLRQGFNLHNTHR